MDVGTLIKKLKDLPPEMEVFVFPDGVEGDYALATEVVIIQAHEYQDFDNKDKWTFRECEGPYGLNRMADYVYIGV